MFKSKYKIPVAFEKNRGKYVLTCRKEKVWENFGGFMGVCACSKKKLWSRRGVGAGGGWRSVGRDSRVKPQVVRSLKGGFKYTAVFMCDGKGGERTCGDDDGGGQ